MNDVRPEQPEQPELSEPATGPVLTPPPAAHTPPPPVAPQVVYVPQPPSRLNKIAVWVGIVAGSVFTVAVIFGTGFVVGKNVGDDGPRFHHRGSEMMLRPGPAMFPMGPPPGGLERGPGFAGPFGPGGPMIEVPRPPGPPAQAPASPAPRP
ncbi:hypothetical protein [Mycobacterium sp. 236(2023)]|uniref:hypothetical protein n=1 Tax=Mycobacterium sp. 236(2023) TaxID=3038163 RepID=UPI002415428D|nr:hypothetical protein [Mycobacterium sp. 236(2023)]MDG4665150.1 hypothetical protein [Mycobacterium sp. 236(2023)]